MIEIVPNQAALARAVAELVVAWGTRAVADRGRFTLALAGGSTPKAAYTLLATPEFAGRLDWARVLVFWGDERCVSPDDPRSNYRMAREALLDRVPIPPGNVHRIQGELEPREAAAEYERLLKTLLGAEGLDLVLLGLGENAHTASLFPGLAAVRETTRWVMAEYVEAVGMWRVTLTPVALNAAKEVVFVVSGASKAEPLRAVLEGPFAPDRLPAQVIRPEQGRVVWLVDTAAAAALSREDLRGAQPS